MAKSNARVPLVERETVPAADLPAYDHVAKSRGAGRMPNVFKALANNPTVMDRVAAVGEYMRFSRKSIRSFANSLFSPLRRRFDVPMNGLRITRLRRNWASRRNS